jgi:hypothetical protein
MRTWIAALVLTACHSAPPPAAPVAPVSQCAKVSDHLVSLMTASQKVDDTQLDPIRKVIAHHCDQDQWTAEAQQCLLAAASMADGEACKAKFTPAQVDAFEAEGRALDESKESHSAPASGGAPPMDPASASEPAPSPPRSTPRPTAKKPGKAGGDPCEGGE